MYCKEAERFHLIGSFYMPCLDSSKYKYCRRCKQCHKSKGERCTSCKKKRVHGVRKKDFETALENWCTTEEKNDRVEYEIGLRSSVRMASNYCFVYLWIDWKRSIFICGEGGKGVLKIKC
mmetsp:Transcript_6558/g.14825  ORF Transcript_6558/g.14825 Transcript_6558/m.14825 type:complete len:120 (-) Transcript_6558:97-456(-)